LWRRLLAEHALIKDLRRAVHIGLNYKFSN
jgi:hypothetical protein